MYDERQGLLLFYREPDGADCLYRFKEAKPELLSLSLIRTNVETGLISIHRLVQQAYYDQMTTESRLGRFNITFSLLQKVFPDL
ncbi:hypothetical protein HD806DRAFT_509440 [Xylariaceae sp. AK1471]|nr:hypothetical protein HD806DRAFT_509440 [Xylariaceae sp. AK1471]